MHDPSQLKSKPKPKKVIESDDTMVQVYPTNEKNVMKDEEDDPSLPRYTGVYDSAKLFEVITSISDPNSER